jgi:hypothetical protein
MPHHHKVAGVVGVTPHKHRACSKHGGKGGGGWLQQRRGGTTLCGQRWLHVLVGQPASKHTACQAADWLRQHCAAVYLSGRGGRGRLALHAEPQATCAPSAAAASEAAQAGEAAGAQCWLPPPPPAGAPAARPPACDALLPPHGLHPPACGLPSPPPAAWEHPEAAGAPLL